MQLDARLVLKIFTKDRKRGSLSVSKYLHTYPSPNPTTVNWWQGRVNVGLGEGWVRSCSDRTIDPRYTTMHLITPLFVSSFCFDFLPCKPKKIAYPVWAEKAGLNQKSSLQIWSRLIKNYTYIGLLQVNLARELFANLIERTSGPITEPVENTPEMKQTGIVNHWKKSQMKKQMCTDVTASWI